MDGSVDAMENERDLLERAAAGDLAAFESVVAAHRDRAYRYALSLVRSHHDALDVAQEAFVRAFRSLRKFDTARPFLPWFLRILRNLAFNRLEKVKRSADRPGRAEDSDTLRWIASTDPGPAARMETQETVALVQAALGTLSADHRDILVLRHFEDLSYEQIAESLEIPVGTVMSRLYHARRNLARALRQKEEQ